MKLVRAEKLTPVDYFTKVLEDNLKAIIKPQYVDQMPKVRSTVLTSIKIY
jgi:translation initiation factor RLI1